MGMSSSHVAALSAPRASGRVVLLDALRGVCFVLMTVDHFPSSPLHRFSNTYFGPLGFFTATVGFVFLSGLVAGRVYERERCVAGTRSMIRRVTYRARALYVTQMIVFLALVAAIELHVRGSERWEMSLVDTHPWEGMAYGATLLYEPWYLGILPIYILFLVLTPIILLQFDKGNARGVLALSALLWVVSGLLIHLPSNPSGVDLGPYNPLAYQFVFISGLAFGTGQLSIERLSQLVRQRLVAVAAVVAAFCLVLRLEYAFGGPLNHLLDELRPAFSAYELGPLRLLNFAAFGLVLYWASQRFRSDEIHARAYSWLAFIGRHSLPVFAWSILGTYAAIALLPPHLSLGLGLLAVVLLAATLTVPAQLHATIRHHRAVVVVGRKRVDELATTELTASGDVAG
jgi:hypothetical protein